MPRGSKPGEHRGGRKAGAPNKTNIARQLRIAEGGIEPLDVLLKNMREADAEGDAINSQIAVTEAMIKRLRPPAAKASAEVVLKYENQLAQLKAQLRNLKLDRRELRQISGSFAVDAAPYAHHKLKTIEYKQPEGGFKARVEHGLDAESRKLLIEDFRRRVA